MIAVIGSNNIDLVCYIDRMPAPGETMKMTDFKTQYGGKGANQAVAAARMDASVMMVTNVGDDGFGTNMLHHLCEEGIDTTYVRREHQTPNGTASIWVDSSSQNRILINEGANGRITKENIDAAANMLKKCSIFILQLEIHLDVVYYAIEFAKKHNITVIFNPAPARADLNMDYVCQCDYVIPNETELAILTNMPTDTMEHIYEAARSLLDRGLKHIVVTVGARGAVWLTGDTIVHLPAYKVNAIDTTGAGDAFIGSFAAMLEQGKPVEEALRWATVFSALSTEKKGAQEAYTQFDMVAKIIESL